ncbi:MAG TPA: electron transfer flavoprotein subunit alpha/FixB family protein, partial [Chlorobaculum parvum]|nr:electron transfer flavoprotein subunit alpha/FixB family protein [Chlorobaculum parvum]
MKLLLVGECRDGRLTAETGELFGFAAQVDAEVSMVLIGSTNDLPAFDGRLYLADLETYGEFRPDAHKRLVLAAIEREQPEAIVLLHSSYGWDMAPRLAAALQSGQVSGVVSLDDGGYVVE